MSSASKSVIFSSVFALKYIKVSLLIFKYASITCKVSIPQTGRPNANRSAKGMGIDDYSNDDDDDNE